MFICPVNQKSKPIEEKKETRPDVLNVSKGVIGSEREFVGDEKKIMKEGRDGVIETKRNVWSSSLEPGYVQQYKIDKNVCKISTKSW